MFYMNESLNDLSRRERHRVQSVQAVVAALSAQVARVSIEIVQAPVEPTNTPQTSLGFYEPGFYEQ